MAIAERVILNRHQEKISSNIYQRIASSIGGSVTPLEVRKFIDKTNENSHILHGIKNLSSVKGVSRFGIKPLTPEGGYISCWTTGRRIFIGSENPGPMQFFDSTFFHYAPSFDRKSGIRSMNIAISNPTLLSINKVPERNSMIAIKSLVSPDKLGLISIKSTGKSANLYEPSFRMLEEIVYRGYRGGERISISV